jgi:HAE1 family hydrophobic/amphiphilic exporter-1/multidrug efflux pump
VSRFFINRPIFAAVISILIVLAGLLSLLVLPVSQYPKIAPPTVMITATYPGASAETLTKTVAAPIEDQLSGVEHLLYFNSTSSSNGTVSITATFEVGTDIDMAAVELNNRVKIAEPILPEEVRRNGVTVRKKSTDILMVVALTSPGGSKDTIELSNYATLNMNDDLKRIPGVGDVQVFGARDYSMRIWLKTDKMAQLGVTTSEVASAIRAQNNQYAAGKIGQEPSPGNQQLVYTVTAKGRLLNEQDFEKIVIRTEGGKGILRLKDVARVELGAKDYDSAIKLDGKPAVAMGIFLQSGANALDVAKSVNGKMSELSAKFPADMAYNVPFDTTKFVSASIESVGHTLFEAIALVVLVVFLFLQSWRATIIPIIAVPVSLIGTFAGLMLMGFSINTLTLFAMVLAIGIVVDDAIVVLENVERLMREKGMAAKEAAIQAMREVSGAVVAIVLVLCAVFIPVAFLGGIAGQLYKQFAVTVAIAVVISGVVALTLTPALCALLLKNEHHGQGRFFTRFNKGFEGLTNFYTKLVGMTIKHGKISLGVFASVLLAIFVLSKTVPGSFVPAEDQGYLFGAIALPDGASLSRTDKTGEAMRNAISSNPAVDQVFVIGGFDMIGGGNKSNAGTMFVPLKDWGEREALASDLAGQFMGVGMGLSDGMAMMFNPPAIMGLGTAGGFEFQVQNRADGDPQKLAKVVNDVVAELQKRPEIATARTFYRSNVPQLFVDVDEEKAISMGIDISGVYETLQATLGSLYVNDFNKFGRTYRVQMEAEAEHRMKPEDIGSLYVKTADGQMVPMSAIATVTNIVGPEQLERFNNFLSAKIMGDSKPGVSSGEAIRAVEAVAEKVLPDGYQIAWTGQALQEKQTGSSSMIAVGFGVLMVFLILAAQYEKWSLPLAVIMAVPFAMLGAFVAVWMRGMPNDVYFQIGLVVLIGLAAKNAILIVEFAQQKLEEGASVMDAALEAARLRFRPIVMTSLAFVLGIVPLVVATGAGAAARQSMGTGVFGGMLAATFVATIFVPLFFKWLTIQKKQKETTGE